MTKQQKIREGRAEVIIQKLMDETNLESPEINLLASELNKEIEDYENSQGVVIKVTQKYPLQPHFIYEPLIAVKTLIKEA